MVAVDMELVVPGGIPLSGTLRLPDTCEVGAEEKAQKLPAILFIHGSGPLDRNENARTIKLNIFNYLAEQLGNKGFASFRYDKRGIAKSQGNYLQAGLWDLVDDATRALTFLKKRPEIDPDRVVLVGHSEGCYIAPLVNQREPVAGIVLLMAPADPLDVVLAYQSQWLEDAVNSIKGVKGKITRLAIRLAAGGSIAQTSARVVRKVRGSTKPVIRYRLSRIQAKWMREHFALDIAASYSSVTCPVLVMNESKDMQVRPEDARMISQMVRGPCEWYIIEGETHILRKDAQEGPSILHYKKLVKRGMDQEIAQRTGDWLARNFYS